MGCLKQVHKIDFRDTDSGAGFNPSGGDGAMVKTSLSTEKVTDNNEQINNGKTC